MKNIFILLCFSFLLFSCGNNSDKETAKDLPNELVNTDAILDSLNKLIIADVNNISLYFERSEYFSNRGLVEKAMNDLTKARRIDSTNTLVYLKTGELLFTNTFFREAKENFEQCLSYDKKEKNCLLNNARMDLLLGNKKEAINGINDAIRIDNFFAEAYFLKGEYYEFSGDTAKAVSSYSTAIEIDPNYFDAYMQIAVMYTSIESDLALEYYNSALDIRPNSVEALQNKGLFFQNTGSYNEAITCYNKAEEVLPANATVNYNKGYIYIEYKNELDSAITEFTNAIAKQPLYFQAYFSRGLCLEKQGKLEGALSDYEAGLSIQPAFTLAALGKERVLKQLNQ